ncbi:type IV toxin-antitoxin system AbiEi family antitoxin [Mycobacterium hubeiense]|uniref:type IV toxin-antitoxin system AbiEi family antitoxin n=1 Tax=Mycobacterium hubeiense TaxID=1867256 RepID=UPI0013044379|nr:type IV toxin-antitoxin system AbiEi family antitoxin [Mycobacterium sp. QGD 101]
MGEPFIGSAALTAGSLTRHILRTRFVALHHDVYIDKDAEITAVVRAKAAWLRSRGHGVLAGFSASALHGARWIDANRPAEIIDTNRRRTAGILVRADVVDDDEVCIVDGMRATTPARTAVDIARRYPLDTAVAAIDALARATRLKVPDIELALRRHRGRRLDKARAAIELVDPGAESPRETWLRLLVIRAGYPPPETQIPIYNEYGALIGVVDMGWRDRTIALEYEGKHHRMSRDAFAKDIRRIEAMIEQGWIVIRVTAADSKATILRRLATAWARCATA